MKSFDEFLQAASNTAADTVSVPVDALAWLSGKAGMPIKEPVGGSDWMKRLGLRKDVKQSAASLAGETFGMISPIGMAAKAPQIARGLLSIDDHAMESARKGLEGYMQGSGIRPGIFAGEGAKTADKAALSAAKEFYSAGIAPRDVWQQTGWFKGGDGKWRFEIDDSAAALRDYNYTPRDAFWNASQRASVGEADHIRAMSMRPYADKTKTQLIDEYSRTGGEIVDAALSGDRSKALQLNADRGGLSAMLEAMRDRRYGPMSAYMKHGDLGAAYPDVYKMHTRIADDLDGGVRGQYIQGGAGRGEQIELGSKPMWSDDKSTALHELQHAIQQREGFAKGGTPESMPLIVEHLADNLRKKSRSLLDVARRNDPLAPGDIVKPGALAKGLSAERQAMDYEALVERMSSFPSLKRDTYKRLAGEAEARAVQKRMNFTPEQRRATFPLDSYDVPIDDLVYR